MKGTFHIGLHFLSTRHEIRVCVGRKIILKIPLPPHTSRCAIYLNKLEMRAAELKLRIIKMRNLSMPAQNGPQLFHPTLFSCAFVSTEW
jgi:hypothetical protein